MQPFSLGQGFRLHGEVLDRVQPTGEDKAFLHPSPGIYPFGHCSRFAGLVDTSFYRRQRMLIGPFDDGPALRTASTAYRCQG